MLSSSIMSLEDDYREIADKKLQDLNRRSKQRKDYGDLWEVAKRDAIRPPCLTLVDVAKSYQFFTANFECNGGTVCDLTLESSKSKSKGVVHLRFALDLERGRITSTSDLEGEPTTYELQPLDAEAIEERVRRFYAAFLDTIDGD